MLQTLFNSNRQGGGDSGLIASLNEGNYSGYLIAFSAVGTSVSLIVSLSLSFSYGQLAGKPPVTLVQSLDGVMSTEEQDHLYRHPATIQKFTGQTLSMLLNWSGKTINQYGLLENDKGVSVGGRERIPTLAHEASNAFTTDGNYRKQILGVLSGWSSRDFFDGNGEQRIEIKKIMIPQALEEEGHWRVNVVANRIIKKGQSSETFKFNRTLLVRAVPIIDDPADKTSTPEQKAFYRIRQFGLEIYQMDKLDRENL